MSTVGLSIWLGDTFDGHGLIVVDQIIQRSAIVAIAMKGPCVREVHVISVWLPTIRCFQAVLEPQNRLCGTVPKITA